MKAQVTLYFILLFTAFFVQAQNIPVKGVPLLQNFVPADYQNKGKIWDISSAKNGIVYMASDKGMLEYDGKKWKTFKGSDGFTRSLLVVNDSLIYTGSDLDFGVWQKNNNQEFEYTSLYPYKKDLNPIKEEFWDVHQSGANIIFVSSQNIYNYKNKQLTKTKAPFKISGSYRVADIIYIADEKMGLYTFDGLFLSQVIKYQNGNSLQITGIYKNKKETVIVTKDAGLYSLSSGKLSAIKNNLSLRLKQASVFCFDQINSTFLVFGTVLKGLYIADLNGKIIHHINKQKGLLNNTILSLHYSSKGKLWLGLDYGISTLNLNNDISYNYDYRGDFGTGYTALLDDKTFYLGTNQGLYTTVWQELNNATEYNRFKLLEGTEGQVWAIENINNTIFIGHDRGLFIIEKNSIKKVNDQQGVWTILPYKKDYFLTGNYNGISIFKKSGKDWKFVKKMELILGSCNQLIIEKDNILWVNIPNFGIMKVVLDDNLFPKERTIFADSIFVGESPYLTKKNGEIQLNTDQKTYHYQSNLKKFLIKDENEILYDSKPLLSNYKYTSLNEEYDFLPIYNGFALKYKKNINASKDSNYSLIFRKAEAFNNVEKIKVLSDQNIPSGFSNIKIEYIVPNQDNASYQFRLKASDQWSVWAADNTYEFLGLPEGKYDIQVRAKIGGQVIEPMKFSFKMDAPWYRTWYAYMLYFLFIFIIFYFMRQWQVLSLQKQKKKLLKKEQNSLRRQAEKHRQEVFVMEQEQLKSEYDQLKQQLKSKTIELANKAKDNEDKNKLLLYLKEKLDEVKKYPAKSNMKLNEMESLLESYLNIEDKTFEIQMDELHQEFFKKLADKFPGLSIYDMRLCAYLKIGLNSREIADLLNVQPSSAYISRSRLRKKLNLNIDEDLHSFLNLI